MNDDESSQAAQDVIATTDSYGGPVSEDELAEVYLAPDDSPSTADAEQGPKDGATPSEPTD